MTAATKSFTQLLGFKDVWLITGGHLITHWYPATFYVLLPIIGKELGLTYTQIGLIISLQHLVGAITNLPGGMLVDAVGRKGYLMATSLFWVGFPYLLIAFLPLTYAALLICIVIGTLFIEAFTQVHLRWLVGGLFLLTMIMLGTGLVMFLREVYVATHTVVTGPPGSNR